MEVLAGLEAGLLEHRDQALARRARVGRRLEHDELAGLQHRRERADASPCSGDEVRLAVRRQRRRDADDDRVGEREVGDARRGLAAVAARR